ncbi:MAG: DVUA0089 family protein [Candidatus Acidiferrales bacterium]
MRWIRLFVAFAVVLFATVAARANSASLSYTGTLANAQSTFNLVFTVGGGTAQNVDFQTWGFGGGTNAASMLIPAGGFDSSLALFAGQGPSALLVNGTADNESNFGSFAGCGPAGTVAFSNGDSICGDINMPLTLTPGTYTLILSDANYVPNAFSDNGSLGEGFTDFTGGAFQTCDFNLMGVMSCITPSGAWAFDITDTTGANLGTSVPTPEPTTLFLLGTGLLALAWRSRSALALRPVRVVSRRSSV